MSAGGRDTENEHQRRERLTFRPESAPTVLAPGVLDMSPDGSLSGSPSHSGHDLSDAVEHDDWLSHFRNIVVGTLQPVTSAQDLSGKRVQVKRTCHQMLSLCIHRLCE